MYILEGYPTAGDERVADLCAKAQAQGQAACLAIGGCGWNVTAKNCAERRRAVEPMEAQGEVYSALGAGTRGFILYRPCDDLHGAICTIGTPTCHGIMDNATLWDNARELNAIASQALELLSFGVRVPNASRSDVAESQMRHDAFSVRNESMVLVVFNRAFNSTVLEYALKEQRNVTIDVGLPPWMLGLDGLVA